MPIKYTVCLTQRRFSRQTVSPAEANRGYCVVRLSMQLTVYQFVYNNKHHAHILVSGLSFWGFYLNVGGGEELHPGCVRVSSGFSGFFPKQSVDGLLYSRLPWVASKYENVVCFF